MVGLWDHQPLTLISDTEPLPKPEPGVRVRAEGYPPEHFKWQDAAVLGSLIPDNMGRIRAKAEVVQLHAAVVDTCAHPVNPDLCSQECQSLLQTGVRP